MECRICLRMEEEVELWAIPEVGIICEKCVELIGKIDAQLKEIKEKKDNDETM